MLNSKSPAGTADEKSTNVDAELGQAQLAQNHLLVAGFPSNENPTTVVDMSVTYSQIADSNSTDDQFLKISISDAGGGVYYVLETARWAINDIDDLIDILKDFKARL